MNKKAKKHFKSKAIKTILTIAISIIAVITVAFIYLNSNAGKQFLKKQLSSYLSSKLKTTISVGRIDFNLPNDFEFHQIFIEDKNHDSLFYGDQLTVSIALQKLIWGEKDIKKIALSNSTLNIHRGVNDSFYNFQFILDVFSEKQTSPKEKIQDSTALSIHLRKLNLDNVSLYFDDANAGQIINAHVTKLQLTIDKFKPAQQQYVINELSVNGFKGTSYITKKSKPTTERDTAKNPLDLMAKNMDLKNISVEMIDTTTGFYYKNHIPSLRIKNANLQLATNNIQADDIILANAAFEVETKKTTSKKIQDTAATINWIVKLQHVSLHNNSFSYNTNKARQAEGLDLNYLNLSGLTVLAKDAYYSKDSLHGLLTTLQLKDHSGFQIDTLHANLIYSKQKISATELLLKTPHSIIQNSLQISYDDLATLNQYPEKVSVNINLQNTVIAMKDAFALMPQLRKNVTLQKLKNDKISITTLVNGTFRQLNIPNLVIATSAGSHVKANGQINHLTNTKQVWFAIHILPSLITKNDLLHFASLPKDKLAPFPSQLSLQADLVGNLNSMKTGIQVGGKNVLLDAKINVANSTNIQKMRYDADIKILQIQREMILAFIPKEKLPKDLSLPNTIVIKGIAKGDMNNITTNLKIGGTYGDVGLRGFVYNFKNTKLATYDVLITTNHFLLGKLLKQDTLIDALTMWTSIKGKSFDLQNMNASIESSIAQIGVKHYQYQGINLAAIISNSGVQSNGSIADPNLQLNYKLTSNSITKPTQLNLFLQLDTAKLHALHLLDDTMDVSSTIQMNAHNLSTNSLDASLRIDSTKITANNQKIHLDSIVVNASNKNESQFLQVQSPILVLNARGKFDYNSISSSVMQYVNTYYAFTKKEPKIIPAQQIALDATVYEHPLVKQFLKGLHHYDSVRFFGQFNSNAMDSALQFAIKAPYISYKLTNLYNAEINLQSINEQLTVLASIDSFKNKDANYYKSALNAFVMHDSIDINVYTKNKTGQDNYAIGTTLALHQPEYLMHLKDRLILNNKAWNVAPNNILKYNQGKFYVNNFSLKNNQSSLSIGSEQAALGSPINIQIKNFLISDITSLLNQDTLSATGIINGNLKISEFEKSLPAFVGDVTINNLMLKQTKVGALHFSAKKQNENTVDAYLTLKENDNDVEVKGNYFLNNDAKQFDAILAIRQLNIASIESFTNGNITNSSGTISGDIHAAGKFAQPTWTGKIHFNNPSFRIQKLGTKYSINNQTLTLNYPDIKFDNFTIADTTNHTLVIDGTVIMNTPTDNKLNVTIRSTDFTMVNTQRSSNEYIFGYAGINANVNMKGSLYAPSIQGAVSLNDATDVAIILPQKNDNKDKALSAVRFIDRDTFPLPEKIKFVQKDSINNSVNTALNYNLNVELSKKASLKIIIDPSTGDELQLNGDAKLNIGVDPGGNLQLVGNYDLAKGHYILHYQFLKRQFELLPQSSILFGGNPLDAQLDIRAAYTANTAAIDLVGNELGDVDSKTVNTFNQKIPFQVLLYIKGSLKKLDISFDIKLPDENNGLSNTIVTTVENKLIQLRADPAAINKQVFSLLVLNRFVGEQSADFFKGNGGGIEDMARESVSKFLSAALDQIASDLIKGVDIDLNLNSYKDYSNGTEEQRTDLNIGVTKRFLNDRLSISLGKDLGIEGDDKSGKARQQSNASYLPNATINYKLSKDGKYMVRAYSKNKFEVILDGYVVESGLSFLVTMDYEKFNELFSRKKIN